MAKDLMHQQDAYELRPHKRPSLEGDMDDLTNQELQEWVYFVGYTDAEFYSQPREESDAYLRGFADGYAEIEMEGARNEM